MTIIDIVATFKVPQGDTDKSDKLPYENLMAVKGTKNVMVMLLY